MLWAVADRRRWALGQNGRPRAWPLASHRTESRFNTGAWGPTLRVTGPRASAYSPRRFLTMSRYLVAVGWPGESSRAFSQAVFAAGYWLCLK